MRLVVLFLCVMSSAIAIGDELSKADKLKAAYLFNFTRYILWPNESEDDKVLRICSYADDSFNAFLSALVSGRTIRDGRTVAVLKPEKEPEKAPDKAPAYSTQNCHLVFFKRATRAEFHSTALLIGDDESYESSGTSIHFFLENRRVRFEVDLQKIEQQQFTISSELLKLARIVNHVSTHP